MYLINIYRYIHHTNFVWFWHEYIITPRNLLHTTAMPTLWPSPSYKLQIETQYRRNSPLSKSPANSSMFQQWSRRCPANSRNVPQPQRRQHPPNHRPSTNFDWPWHPRPTASSSTTAVFIDDRPSEPRRVHHRRTPNSSATLRVAEGGERK
jgi:hypothetical protein